MKVADVKTENKTDYRACSAVGTAEHALWNAVLLMTVKDLAVEMKLGAPVVAERVRNAYNFFTSRHFEKDRAIVFELCGLENPRALIRGLKPHLDAARKFLIDRGETCHG